MPGVSVIVPTYEEFENLKLLIPLLHQVLQGREHEIVVVDDNSQDGTRELVESLSAGIPGLTLLNKEKKEGIGAALRVGYDRGRHDVLLSLDADLSFDVEEIPKLLRQVEAGDDLVLGCRHYGGGSYDAPTLKVKAKYLLSSLGNRVVRKITGLPLHDYSANFRAIRRTVWRAIETQDRTNSLLLEMILKVAYGGYRVTELPVRFKDRRFGRSKLNLVAEIPKFLLRLVYFTVKLRVLGIGVRRKGRDPAPGAPGRS